MFFLASTVATLDISRMRINVVFARALALLAGAALLAGCYTQRPLSGPLPAQGARIVAQLTDTGTVVMGNALGPGATEVEGEVVEASPAQWRLSVVRVDQRGGISNLWSREQVTFPRYTLTRISERRLDRTRSWLVAGAIVGGAFLAARAFGAFSVSDEGGATTAPPK